MLRSVRIVECGCNSPCVDAWHGHRSPAPSGLAVLLWWLGFWYLCSSDQVSMNLESWFVKESKWNHVSPGQKRSIKESALLVFCTFFHFNQLRAAGLTFWMPDSFAGVCGLLWFQPTFGIFRQPSIPITLCHSFNRNVNSDHCTLHSLNTQTRLLIRCQTWLCVYYKELLVLKISVQSSAE